MNETLMKTEYSETFDEKRKGLIEQSYDKYGRMERWRIGKLYCQKFF